MEAAEYIIPITSTDIWGLTYGIINAFSSGVVYADTRKLTIIIIPKEKLNPTTEVVDHGDSYIWINICG